MEWEDFVTDAFYKQDFCIEGPEDFWYFRLLEDSYFEPEKIRYFRKRLVIPIRNRVTHEWNPVRYGLPGGYVDGELILYPVTYGADWQMTVSGEKWCDPGYLPGIRKITVEKKTSDKPAARRCGELGEYYLMTLELIRYLMPMSFLIMFREVNSFPLIRYRDICKPFDAQRQPLHWITGDVIESKKHN